MLMAEGSLCRLPRLSWGRVPGGTLLQQVDGLFQLSFETLRSQHPQTKSQQHWKVILQCKLNRPA